MAASAECFVSGSGLTGNPRSLSALGSAGCGHRAAGDGLGAQQDGVCAWESTGCLQTPVLSPAWAFQGAWLPLPTRAAGLGLGSPPVPSSCWQLEEFLADGGSRCQQLLLMAA